MKHLKTFSLFEGNKSNYRHTLNLPKTQEELDVINNSPEMKDYIKICGFSTPFYGFTFNKNGALILPTSGRYEFKIVPSGTIYYGGVQIGPSSNYSFNTIFEILDFLTIYNFSREYGISVNALDKFVFDGNYPGDKAFSNISKANTFDVVVKIAKKYNPSDLIDSVIDKKNASVATYLTDPSLILNTESYKFLSNVYNFKIENINEKCLYFRPEYLSPFGLFDDFIKETSASRRNSMVCLGLNGDIRVKTLKGLDNQFRKYLIDNILSLNEAPKIDDPEAPEMLSINKQIKNAIIESLKGESLDLSASSFNILIDVIEKIRISSPLKFSKIINTLKGNKLFSNVVDHFASDSDIIKVGGLLGRFGITDDED
jgi:hypothetical protein